MIRFYEWLAGKLLVRSARARLRRSGPDDAHEIRHLYAAVNAGNSDPCKGGSCHLDEALMRSPLSAWGEDWLSDPLMNVYDQL